MEVWGITGLRGAGKSTAIRHLKELGYPAIDADQVAQIVVNRNTPEGREGFEAIYKLFGSSVLDNLGNLDKRSLLKRILMNPADRERIEAVVDPLVLKHIENVSKDWKSSGKAFGFIEGGRLAEAGFHRVISGIILVSADITKRINRVAKRDSMGKLEVEQMMTSQIGGLDGDLMRRVAKKEWKNDGTEAAFKKAIDAFVMERKAAQASK